MKPDWFVSPQALSRARLDRLLSQEQLARKSGVSLRSINGYEREEQPVRQETLQCLAKALEVEARDLGIIRPTGRRDSARPARASEPPPVYPPPDPTLPVVAPTSALPARTQLETIIDIERAAGLDNAPVETPDGLVERLSAKRLQDVFTAYMLHEGVRFCLCGRVDAMRGIAPEEAKLIGGQPGVASRFHILEEVTPGRPVAVTIHAASAEHVTPLQAAYGADVTVFLRVVAVPKELVSSGAGFSSFITRSLGPRPWTFVVEAVKKGRLGGTGTNPKGAKTKKTPAA